MKIDEYAMEIAILSRSADPDDQNAPIFAEIWVKKSELFSEYGMAEALAALGRAHDIIKMVDPRRM